MTPVPQLCLCHSCACATVVPCQLCCALVPVPQLCLCQLCRASCACACATLNACVCRCARTDSLPCTHASKPASLNTLYVRPHKIHAARCQGLMTDTQTRIKTGLGAPGACTRACLHQSPMQCRLECNADWNAMQA